MHSGTEQSDRLPKALRNDYFLPDEFSLAQRIRLIYGYARQLHFMDDMAHPTGHWGEALARDESVMLADLAAYPVDDVLKRLLDEWSRLGLRHKWARVYRLCLLVDRWCTDLSEHAHGIHVAKILGHAIAQDLSPLFQPCAVVFGLPLSFEQVRHTGWRQESLAMPARESSAMLRELALALGRVMRNAQEKARVQLPLSLRSQQHEPAMGLLLTALQLIQLSRAPLNAFPDRLTDFYYLDVLRMRHRSRPAEKVHVLLERNSLLVAPVRIEAGMRFIAGQDAEGAPIEFAADQSLELGRVRVASLLSLRLERDPLISPEREFGYATRIKSQKIPLQSAAQGDVASPLWWPLLGGSAKDSAANPVDAQLGLVIASPLLALKQGRRDIRISLRLSHPAQYNENLKRSYKNKEITVGADVNQGWLEGVFKQLEKLEQEVYPDVERPSADDEPKPDPTQMAMDVLKRCAQFDVDVLLCFLLQRCIVAQNEATYFRRLGRLFSAWLGAGSENLRKEDVTALRQDAARRRPAPDQWQKHDQKCKAMQPDDPFYLVYGCKGKLGCKDKPGCKDIDQALVCNDPLYCEDQPNRALVFDRIFRSLWRAQISTADGWMSISNVYAVRHESEAKHAGTNLVGGCIDLSMTLMPEHPPIVACTPSVHGAMWSAQPTLQLLVKSQSRIQAFNLLDQMVLQSISIEVQVEGLRNLLVYNQLGRLDASKPFAPFGPLPTPRSYLIFGSPELARKPLNRLDLKLTWGNLPSLPGGFAQHYAGYPGKWDAEVFHAHFSILRDGQWQSGHAPDYGLFVEAGQQTRLQADRSLCFNSEDLLRLHRASPVVETRYAYDLNCRNGFFKLELSADESSAAFGHALYPHLLTEVLTRNARFKRQDPLPREAYTPSIEQLNINYTASQEIHLGSDAHMVGDERVFRLMPFGHDVIYPNSRQERVHLLPGVQDDGQLYIGLAGEDPQGMLHLYFQLRAESAAESLHPKRAALHWDVWKNDGWKPLPIHRQLADGTLGFLRSGIVSLDLPHGMSTDCSQLTSGVPVDQPEGMYWLRLRSNWGFEFLAGLCGVHAHAVTATRVQQRPPMPTDASASSSSLPPGSITGPRQSVPGLRGVYQAGPSFGLQPPPLRDMGTTKDLLRMSTSERLRHKNRATTCWDYERLVLDQFPGVLMVKCLAHARAPQGRDISREARAMARLSPGQVLVVVVPMPKQGQQFESTQSPRLDACMLDDITCFLRERASPSAQIVVRNAVYEHVQVRCELSLDRGVHPGSMLRQLNQSIVEYLSPWRDSGYAATFDWEVRVDHIEAHLRACEGVSAVGGLSLLHVVRSDANIFTLGDTVLANTEAVSASRITPAHDWSLVLPTSSHLLSISHSPGMRDPQPTGVAKLEIGSTFIIDGAKNDA